MKTDERRQFNRVVFNTTALLSANKKKYECEIIDLSIQGVLLTLFEETDLEMGCIYKLDIPLGDAHTANTKEMISMEIELMHQIDLDSITHLRRLVELNLGDSELLERDFASLLDDNQK